MHGHITRHIVHRSLLSMIYFITEKHVPKILAYLRRKFNLLNDRYESEAIILVVTASR